MWPRLEALAQTVVYDATKALPAHLARAQHVEVPGGAGHDIPAEATAKLVDAFLSDS